MAELNAVAVTGGKGGAGKSTIAVNLAALLSDIGYRVLLVDADVDNPNDYIYLGMERREAGRIVIRTPAIDQSLCDGCLECVRICPTHALLGKKGNVPLFFEDSCLGCSLCAEICPRKAIKEGKKEIGTLYDGESGKIKMISAAIRPGEARSPLIAHNLVRFFRQIDKNQFDKIIIDTCPGVANPVMQALRLADHALIVTEPTPLGLNTMKLSLKAIEKLNMSFDIVINRADVPSGITEAIEEDAAKRGARIFRIPYDEEIIEAAVNGVPVVRRNNRIRQVFLEILREVFSID
ncbi:MAG: P-loop NTPase [Candidatus Methanodesulfokora sp.]